MVSSIAVATEKTPTVGEEELMYQAFLRKTTVILNPYQESLNFSLQYKRDSTNILNFSRINREFGITMSYHYGFPKNIEAFVNIPLLCKYRIDQFFLEDYENKYSNKGIGDLSLGSVFILLPEKGLHPDIVGTLEISIPTGENPYSEDPDSLELGSGHWSGKFGITAIKSCDPAVVYGGIEYTYIFEKVHTNNSMQPGEIIGCNLGVAFLINDKLTLGEQLIGNYQTEAKINSEKILFSSTEPIMLRSSLTYALSKNISIDPSILFGLNEDAADVLFELSYSRRF